MDGISITVHPLLRTCVPRRASPDGIGSRFCLSGEKTYAFLEPLECGVPVASSAGSLCAQRRWAMPPGAGFPLAQEMMETVLLR